MGTRTDAKIARLARLLDVALSGLATNDLLFYNGLTQKWENKAGFATETNTGIGRIATQAEMNAGLLDNVFVTPLKVATYVNALVAGGVQFIGGYDAATNTPNLVTPAPGVVFQGDMYVVTVAGTFFGEDLEIGDSLIATIDDPVALSDWIRVEKNQPIYEYPQTIFVSPMGNNLNDGTNPQTAVLTIEQAVTLATALTPTVTNQILISLNAGDYSITSATTLPQYVHIIGEAANIDLQDNLILSGENIVKLNDIFSNSGAMLSDALVSFGDIYIDVNKAEGSLTPFNYIGLSALNVYIKCKYINKLDNTGSTIQAGDNTTIYLEIDNIDVEQSDGFAGTYAISATGTGKVRGRVGRFTQIGVLGDLKAFGVVNATSSIICSANECYAATVDENLVNGELILYFDKQPQLFIGESAGTIIDWAGRAATSLDLQAVLTNGNTTGANDILVDSGRLIQFGAATEYITDEGANVISTYSDQGVWWTIGADCFAELNTGCYFIVKNDTTDNQIGLYAEQQDIVFLQGDGFSITIRGNGISTAARVQQLQDADGTIALLSDILTQLLTGISFASTTPITATDNILQALGQLQAQVSLNNAKVSNATHTGEVTGATALTIDKTAISNRAAVTAVGSDYILIGDTSDSNNLKKALVSDLTGASSWLTTTVSPAQVTANQNNYAPAGLAPKVMLRVDLNANRDFTGFDSTGFADRDYFLLANISTKNLKLKANDANSLAANRIDVSADTTINAGHSLILVYDATSARWRVTTNKP